MPVEISGGTLSGGTTAGGGDTGGYDILGTGVVGDPTRGGQVTLADISGGDSSDDAYVAALQAKVDEQVKQQAIQRLQQAGLPQVVQQGYKAGLTPYEQLKGRIDYNLFPDIGLLSYLNKMGTYHRQGLLDRIEQGAIPVYDRNGQIIGARVPSETGDKIAGFLGDTFGFQPEKMYTYWGRGDFNNQDATAIKDKFGNVIGYELAQGRAIDGDDTQVQAPEATVVAAAQPEPEKSMIEQGYRYPAGGYYPQEGRFLRQGLLDVAPTTYGGLLSGYDPTQFGAMNVGFRQPTDVSLFQDPYDVAGYSLLA